MECVVDVGGVGLVGFGDYVDVDGGVVRFY